MLWLFTLSASIQSCCALLVLPKRLINCFLIFQPLTCLLMCCYNWKSDSLTQQFCSMCVFQVLLAGFIDTHNNFIASSLAVYCYCQVSGMQSSVLMGSINENRTKSDFFYPGLKLQSCQVTKWGGGVSILSTVQVWIQPKNSVHSG